MRISSTNNQPATRTTYFLLENLYIKEIMMTSQFPLARIRTIMRSSPETELISHEAVLLIAKSTELFVDFLAKEAYKRAENKKKIDYKEVAEVAQTDNRLDFLNELVPRKITIKEFKEILNNQPDTDEESGEMSDDGESQSESQESRDSDVQSVDS